MPPNKIGIKILCFLIILISGIIIGICTTVQLVKHKVIWVNVTHKDVNEITRKITVNYDLTSQQTEQVHQILERAFERRKLRDAELTRKREESAQIVISEMNSVLTPEQYTKWLQAFREVHERIKKRK